MKQTLQLKIGQQLTMTPQLQQAIRLLQLSTLDLQAEIQEALESNPMLDVTEDDAPSADGAQADKNPEPVDPQTTETKETTAEASSNDDQPTAEDNWNDDIPEHLGTDSSWEDTFQSSGPSGAPDDSDAFENNDSSEESLYDHLAWQLNLTPMSDVDRLIATNIIDGIEPDGYLTITLDEIHEHLQESLIALDPDYELDISEVEAVLRRVQQFDPAGVGARDLGECLTIQLEQLPASTPCRDIAIKLASNHLKLLGAHDYRQLMRKLRIKEPQLREAIELIQQQNPKPGSEIAGGTAEYVVPDVIVTKIKEDWVVNLNPEISPRLRINSNYADLVRRADNSADNTYLKNHLQEARWFIKSLQSRNDTLLKVAREIVARQEGFLEHGEESMRPMVLHDIAEAVEMHESTISRVTTQKFMHTPRGIFELKYFFSSHVNTSDGGAASSTAIRALIKKLVAAENAAKPLSDSKIAKFLEEQGFNVARRTVAKYREAMNIPPSNERKRLV